MKKNNRLLYLLNDIDPELIEEAAPTATAGSSHAASRSVCSSVKFFRLSAVGWLSAAACICLLAAGAFAALRLTGPFGHHTNLSQWPTKEIVVATKTTTEATTEAIAIIPRWEEQPINCQFGEVEYHSARYTTRAASIAAEHIGSMLGTAVLSGYDIYEDASYTANASLYTIKTISEECAIALQFDGHEEYYVYANMFYRPDTLGEFIDALSLRDHLSTGSVSYHYWKDPVNHTGYTTVEFTGLQTDVVWDMLLSDPTLKNENYDTDWHISAMSISVSVPLLGYENISIGLTEEGYLTTNILDSRKVFFIGPEKVALFMDYVKETCTGHEIVYRYETEENETGRAGDVPEETVMYTSQAMPPAESVPE